MNKKIYNLILCSISVCILVVFSWINIPFPIPITLQLIAVFVISGLFDWKISITSIAAYIILGIIGLPVFSSFNGGLAFLFGPTGGYIISFLIVPFITLLFKKVFNNSNTCSLIVSFIVSLLLIYTIGTLWYLEFAEIAVSHITFTSIIMITVVPFIFVDTLKIIISVFSIKKLRKILVEKTKI